MKEGVIAGCPSLPLGTLPDEALGGDFPRGCSFTEGRLLSQDSEIMI